MFFDVLCSDASSDVQTPDKEESSGYLCSIEMADACVYLVEPAECGRCKGRSRTMHHDPWPYGKEKGNKNGWIFVKANIDNIL